MPLPSYADEAGWRALDAKCANFFSSTSKNTVARLSVLPPTHRGMCLGEAVAWGLPNLVRCALEAKISANSRGGGINRPVLVQAAFQGSICILKQLLDAGADHSLTDSEGHTALGLAARRGHLDCIHLLLSAGADANKAESIGLTPLMGAVICKMTACARALLPASNLLATNREGRTAFHLCALMANEECFDLILPLMSDVDLRTLPGTGVNGQAMDPVDKTVLHHSCIRGQQQMARALLKRGANRMARDSLQRTPLHDASLEGHLSCCVLLVGQPGRRKMSPAEVDAADVNGFTALHLSASQGSEKICGFLLEAGARLDAETSDGHTPLMIAQQFHPTNAGLLALLSGQGPAALPGTVCDHCGKTAAQASVNNLKACSQCHAVRYCGAACSAAAWAGHKKACRARAKEREEAAKPTIIPSPSSAGQAAAQ